MFIKFNNFGTWNLNGPRHLFYSFCCTTQHIFEPLHVYKPGFNMDKYDIGLVVAKKTYHIETLRLSIKRFVYVLIWKQMTDNSYHVSLYIGNGIGISISKILSSILDIVSTRKKRIGPPLTKLCSKSSTSKTFSC